MNHVRQYPSICMDNDNNSARLTRLPPTASLPINRCNLPAAILGGLTFQRHPVALSIDGVRELHHDLFRKLACQEEQASRAALFIDYMAVGFRLNALGDAGYDPASAHDRPNADYRRTLRGWSFDSDSREGAVLKGWAESRFGLITRFHRIFLPSPDSDDYRRFTRERARALYNTNALEGQLDLVYMFTQHELSLRGDGPHLTLYRGVNGLPRHEIVRDEGKRKIILLNNMNSFTASAERAGEFGDTVITARVPLAKVFFAANLLPGMLQGEDEYVVIGGLYEVGVL